MTCLYCKTERPAKGREHVYPEALGTHEMVLPRGAVCDTCNQGVLRQLDSAVLQHPHVSAVVYLFDIPGKGGKLRKRVGHYVRPDSGVGMSIELPGRATRDIRVDEETGRIFVLADPHPEFREDLFCRGVFKIALNFVAWKDGVERALGPDYDSTREFILRPPTRRARLRFVQRRLCGNRFEDVPAELDPPSFRRHSRGRFDAVLIRLFVDDYLVDLVRPEQVTDLLRGTWPDDEANVIIHEADGSVRRLDGSPLELLTLDSPNHPWAAELARAKRVDR